MKNNLLVEKSPQINEEFDVRDEEINEMLDSEDINPETEEPED